MPTKIKTSSLTITQLNEKYNVFLNFLAFFTLNSIDVFECQKTNIRIFNQTCIVIGDRE
mgnify:CR=1 FL=1